MPFTIVRNDITKLKVDAIVNAANRALQMGAGVCGAVFAAAGAERLSEACDKLAPINTGESVITPGFNLQAKYIIHTAGPVYHDGKHGEESLLRACYVNSLELAVKNNCESIAFPLISSGVYGYPKSEALRVASEAVREFLSGHDLDVILVVFDKESFVVSENLLGAVRSYIDQHYVDEKHLKRRELIEAELAEMRERGITDFNSSIPFFPDAHTKATQEETGKTKHAREIKPPIIGSTVKADIQKPDESYKSKLTPPGKPIKYQVSEDIPPQAFPTKPFYENVQLNIEEIALERAQKRAIERIRESARESAGVSESCFDEAAASQSIDDLIGKLDEPFTSTLFRLVDRSGMKDADIYRRANIDRRLFSKIRSNPNYAPSKPTVIALAVALELTLEQTEDLLERAGFALSHSRKFDVIVEFFIQGRKYDIYEINEVLFSYDQPLLGGC